MARRSALQLAAQLVRSATAQRQVASVATGATPQPAASLAAWFAAAAPARGYAANAARARTPSSTIPSSRAHQTFRGVSQLTFPGRGGGNWWRSGGGGSGGDLNPSRVVWGLIAANGAVFMLWQSKPYAAHRHFVVSLDSLRDGRLWTAATSAFSQQQFGHLASNMITLYFFGTGVGQLFGGRKLLGLYLAGGIVGSLAHCGWTYYKERQAGMTGRPAWMRGPARGALGASAAVNAIVVTDILLFPTKTILLYGIVPMPAALLGVLWLVYDVSGAVDPGGRGSVAHAGHLGGALTGLAFWAAYKRGRIRPQRWW